MVSQQVRHKLGSTTMEDDKRLELLVVEGLHKYTKQHCEGYRYLLVSKMCLKSYMITNKMTWSFVLGYEYLSLLTKKQDVGFDCYKLTWLTG